MPLPDQPTHLDDELVAFSGEISPQPEAAAFIALGFRLHAKVRLRQAHAGFAPDPTQIWEVVGYHQPQLKEYHQPVMEIRLVDSNGREWFESLREDQLGRIELLPQA